MVAAASSDDRFRHLALLYRGRDEYMTALGGFIQASRERGDVLFVAIPQRNTQPVYQELGDGADVTLADMAELGRNPARIIPALLVFADKHRGRHVCCIGEPIWPGRTRTPRRSGEIICQVADAGQFTDPLAWHQAPAVELPGGKGLWLVNQICDLVQVRTGQAGTVIRLHMRLRRPSAGRRAQRQGH